MLRQVFTLLILSTLVFADLSHASAQSDAKPVVTGPAPATSPAATGPLEPGPAAGIKQAQGAFRNRIWNYAPFAFVGVLALLVVLGTGDDDDGTTTTTTTTTGTN